MNDNGFENELNYELSPEEAAFVDRILSSTAEIEDSEVDYDGMLKSIKARAKAEGIVTFPSAKAKKDKSRRSSLIRSMLVGASAAAAVLVLGFVGLMASGLLGTKSLAPSAYNDEPSEHIKHTGSDVMKTADISSATSAPNEDKKASPEASYEGAFTFAPTSAPVWTDAPIETEVPTYEPQITPLITQVPEDTTEPTSQPVKGGTIEYISLEKFYRDPTEPEQLIPLFSEPMFITVDPESMYVYAMGEDPETGNALYYSCRPAAVPDKELEIGSARVTLSDPDGLRYVWRVSETCFLDCEFEGFDRDTAEELLLTLPLCSAASEIRGAA